MYKIFCDSFWLGFGLGWMGSTVILMLTRHRALRAYRSTIRLLRGRVL